MTAWITQRKAAEILGVHVSRVAKLVAQGHLTSRGRFGKASLDRTEVEVLAVERERRRSAPPPPRRPAPDPRPDREHEWLTPVHLSSAAAGRLSDAERVVDLGKRVLVW